MTDVREPRAVRPADDVGVPTEVGAEECDARDSQGQAHHLRSDVHYRRGTSLLPFTHALFGRLDHVSAEPGKVLPMESRLHEPAVPKPRFALAGEQPVAEQEPDHTGEERRLMIVLVVLGEHMLHGFGVRQEIAIDARKEANAHTIPVLAPGVPVQAEGVFS